MRNTALLFASLALTVLCWGMYGPVLRSGQEGMSTIPGQVARLRPFVCVGFAYFLIGVIVPSLWLHLRGEKGEWTLRGIAWSLAGGALGALGALGIILAFTFGGRPIYVMPIVFGGAPVVNAFLTIYMAGRVKEIGPLFLAGLIIVMLGAVVVLAAPHGESHSAPAASAAEIEAATAQPAEPAVAAAKHGNVWTFICQLLSMALAVVSWGAYGPVLHKGQAAMHHSRMRPLICVGLAYFVIAVIIPYFFLGEMGEASTYRSFGTLWSLMAGSFGAFGALGIILAFNSGGRPVFVMPLVFGGAPVVNTFFTISTRGDWDQVSPFFWAGLILVVAGSVMVLLLAPRGEQGQGSRVEGREPEEGGGRKAEVGVPSERMAER
jgi:drug/metabolite transporter (DMT)-like permease